MSYGYTCNWCKKPGKSIWMDNYPQLPKNWIKTGHDIHICGGCISKGKSAVCDNQPKTN